MNKWTAYDLFEPMRSSTIEEQQLYHKMLKKHSIPTGRSIWNMGDIEVDYCDICHEKKKVNRKYYYYRINCECCGSTKGHFEIIRYCDECEPVPPKYVQIMLKPLEEG